MPPAATSPRARRNRAGPRPAVVLKGRAGATHRRICMSSWCETLSLVQAAAGRRKPSRCGVHRGRLGGRGCDKACAQGQRPTQQRTAALLQKFKLHRAGFPPAGLAQHSAAEGDSLACRLPRPPPPTPQAHWQCAARWLQLSSPAAASKRFHRRCGSSPPRSSRQHPPPCCASSACVAARDKCLGRTRWGRVGTAGRFLPRHVPACPSTAGRPAATHKGLCDLDDVVCRVRQAGEATWRTAQLAEPASLLALPSAGTRDHSSRMHRLRHPASLPASSVVIKLWYRKARGRHDSGSILQQGQPGAAPAPHERQQRVGPPQLAGAPRKAAPLPDLPLPLS